MVVAREDTLPEAISAAIEAALIWSGLEILAPGARFATTTIGRYLLGRHERARDILRSQLELAGASEQDFRDADQIAAAGVRYMRAARDQAADENLRILAQAMIGLARRAELWASDFLKYAELLAPLSRDELILLGLVMTEHARFYSTPRPQNSEADVWYSVMGKALESFPRIDYVSAVAARAQRSGLIIPFTGRDAAGHHVALRAQSEAQYKLSPIGIALRQIVDIPAALYSDLSEEE